MADASQKLNITVEVDAQGAIRIFDELGNKIKETSGEVTRGESFWTTYNQALQGATQTFAMIKGGVTATFDALKRGSEVADVAEAFEKLATQAGATAETLQGALREATGGTLSDLKLQKEAIEGLRAGLKPDEFLTITKAARGFAEQGGDLAEILNGLERAYQTGQDRMLRQYGIIIDNQKAEAELAKTLGIKAKQLSETDKIEASRIAIIEALNQKVKEQGIITNDTGDSVEALGATWENTKNQVLEAIATNKELESAFNELSKAMSEIDIKALAEDLSYLIGQVVILAEKALPWATKSLREFTLGVKVLEEMLGHGVGTGSAASIAAFEEAFAKLNTQLKQAKGKDGLAAVYKDMQKALKALGETNQEVQSALYDTTLVLAEDYADALEKVDGAQEDLKRSTDKTDVATDNAARGTRDYVRALKDERQEIKTGLAGLEQYEGELKKIVEAYNKGWLTNDEMSDSILKVEDAFLRAKFSGEQLNKVLTSATQGIKDTDESVGELQKKTSDTGFWEGLLGFDIDAINEDIKELPDVWSKVWEQVGAQVAQGLTIALNMALSGKQVEGAIGGAIGGIGGTIGGALLGEAIGGEAGAIIGAQVGASIGQALGQALERAFGQKDSAGTRARKEVDKYFADLFSAARLQVIVNGEITKLEDMVFQGMTNFGGEASLHGGPATGYLQTLEAGVQNAFIGVGTAYEQLTGSIGDFQGYLAGVLANNLGNLNNLQIALEAVGATAEDLSKALMDAFMQGTITAVELQKGLIGIQQVMTKGIPDAVGAVETAFQNLKDAGTRGGRVLVDALQDIGFEAKELGYKTLDQVMAKLAATGKYSAQEIRQVMDALKAAGLDSVDALINATTEQLIPVLAQLEAQGFLKETANTTEDIITQVNSLPNNVTKNINFNVHTTLDANSKEILPGIYNTAYGKSPPWYRPDNVGRSG